MLLTVYSIGITAIPDREWEIQARSEKFRFCYILKLLISSLAKSNFRLENMVYSDKLNYISHLLIVSFDEHLHLYT